MIGQEEHSVPTIMVLGKHLYTVEHVIKLLQADGYKTLYMLEEYEEFDRRLLEQEFNVLLIVGSIEPHFQADIIKKVQTNKENVKILIHRGGPATIPAEVRSVLKG